MANELKSLTLNGKTYDSFVDQEARKNGGTSAEGAVLYTEQSLTDAQKTQARENIGAIATVNGNAPDENGNVTIETGGGSGGATAEQIAQIEKNKTDITQLSEQKADKTAIPVKTSQLTNDSDYVTSDVTTAISSQLASETAARTSAVNTERSERQTEIAVERARINSFTRLAEGSTTGDAELQDIRVGYDGTVYDTAGEAVRGQMGAITANMELRNIGNLIDKDAVSEDALTNTGRVDADERFCHTDFIEVKPGETLNFKVYSDTPVLNAMRWVVAYDEYKVVQPDNGFNTAQTTYTVPDGIAYIRATIRVEDKDYAVLVSGELPEEYVPYREKSYYATERFIEDVTYTKNQIDDKFDDKFGVITANMELRNIGNLIDKNLVSDGMMTTSGNVTADDRYVYTDFIPVTAGEIVNYKVYSDDSTLFKFLRFVIAYDENKNVQATKGSNAQKPYYEIPEGVAYIRATIGKTAVDYAVLVHGELPENYIPYTGENYVADENFLARAAYSKPQTDALIKKESEKISFAIHTQNSPNVPIPIVFEQGNIDSTTGQDSTSEYSFVVRSAGYISAKCGDTIKFNVTGSGKNYRLYTYSADGAFIERTDVFYFDRELEATEDCFYRIICSKPDGTTITPDEVTGIFTMTTAFYKRNGFVNLNVAYVKETDKVIEEALDETADLRLLCFADPHNFDDYKYHKYNEIMGRGVVDYLVGLGDYVDYTQRPYKNDYRRLLLNAINKAGREANRIYVTGNHDVSMKPGGAAGTSDIDLVLRPKECFDLFYRHLKQSMVADPENPYGGYFYVDDVQSKIRLIILNSNEIVNDDGTVTWYYEQSKISQRQLDWFTNIALKVDEEGWSVVVFLHNDTPYGSADGCGNALFDILSAAQNGTSVHRTFTAYRRMITDANGAATTEIDKTNGDTYTINADFNDGHSVSVIAVFHGHTHEKDWRERQGIKSICVRTDYGHLDDRYICKGTFVRNAVYCFTDIYGHIYKFTTPDTTIIDNTVHFEYSAYHTQDGRESGVGYFVLADGNQYAVATTLVPAVPSGATELTGFVRERDGSLAGEESCEIVCINKDTRTITTIPYGTGTRRVITY